MYTYGYRNYESAYALLDTIAETSDPCRDCDTCTVNCPKGFHVADRIGDVSRLSGIPRDLMV
jgi:predicted aldo/keto reductase-like oxidoreductase